MITVRDTRLGFEWRKAVSTRDIVKPLRQQFVDVLGYKVKNLTYYRDFVLTVVAGFAVVFGEIFGMDAHSTGSAFDMKVALGCGVLLLVCFALTSRKLVLLGCAAMIPAVLIGRHVFFRRDPEGERFYWLQLAAGVLVFVVGGIIQSLWQRLRTRRTR